tara:strand:+ start:4523 stop:5515 length:993 start_codon:yes stop_codon:yes gene_type:complete
MRIKFLISLLFLSNIIFSADEPDLVRIIEKSTFQINVVEKNDDDGRVIGNGSAVLINRKNNDYFFITNAHVVLKAACIVDYSSACDDGESDEWPEDIDLYVTHPFLENEYLVLDYIYWEDVDFAVLKAEMFPYEADDELYDEYLSEISPIRFTSNYIDLMDTVYAAGYPNVLGNLTDYKEIFITSGIINSFIISEKSLSEVSQYDVVHDAVIKGGMSGGPLVNKRGELVGINGLIEGSYTINNSNSYMSWLSFFHSHDDTNDVDVGKFSYAISSFFLLWTAFSDPSRLLFEDPDMKAYLPRFNKVEDAELYDYLIMDAEDLKNDLDMFFK